MYLRIISRYTSTFYASYTGSAIQNCTQLPFGSHRLWRQVVSCSVPSTYPALISLQCYQMLPCRIAIRQMSFLGVTSLNAGEYHFHGCSTIAFSRKVNFQLTVSVTACIQSFLLSIKHDNISAINSKVNSKHGNTGVFKTLRDTYSLDYRDLFTVYFQCPEDSVDFVPIQHTRIQYNGTIKCIIRLFLQTSFCVYIKSTLIEMFATAH